MAYRSMASKRSKKNRGGSKNDVGVSKETLAKVAAIRESSKRATTGLSSSEEESGEENEQLITTALSKYYQLLGDQEDNIRTQLVTSSTSCIVCLTAIKRSETVWSCHQCYCVFHLMCIQQWARDGVKVQNAVLSPELFPDVHENWSCPKCRLEYPIRSIPQRYTCYCGKHVSSQLQLLGSEIY